MVPAFFVALENLPLTPNGKVDRQRLPHPQTSMTAPASRVAPATPQESLIAAIWAEVLGIRDPGVEDNFFELGGDSLSATRVFARMNKNLGASLSLREFLDRPTIRGVAARVASGSVKPKKALPPIVPRRRPATV
jgi:fengycin family lipopeptide synthetase D/tyrocidine synthetase-2